MAGACAPGRAPAPEYRSTVMFPALMCAGARPTRGGAGDAVRDSTRRPSEPRCLGGSRRRGRRRSRPTRWVPPSRGSRLAWPRVRRLRHRRVSAPGGVELVMSPGLALCEACSQESSSGGFRHAGLARREVGWISLRWARITQAAPGRPGSAGDRAGSSTAHLRVCYAPFCLLRSFTLCCAPFSRTVEGQEA